jgi:hypothetical protein
MKRNFHSLFMFSALSLLILGGCTKENKVTYNGGTAPVLTATKSDSIPLPVTDTLATAVSFAWTNPQFTFSNGVVPEGVTYYLEIDTAGANFSSGVLQQIEYENNLSTTFTVSKLNNVLGNSMGLDTGRPHQIQIRLEAFLQPYTSGSSPAVALYSDTLNYTVYTYVPPPVVALPSSGTLWITGSATPLGWMTDAASVAGQELTRVGNTNSYAITMNLIGGGQFLLVPVAGNWSNKYATIDASASPSGDVFSYNAANNFNGPASSGSYTVTFNFQTGTYTIVAQ